jgi:ADP-ribose pyrophosphatase YjhB (NUDIX family)
LLVLLVKRSNHPDMGKWGLPGGLRSGQVSLEDTANRKHLENRRCTALPRAAPTIGNDAATSGVGP